MSLTKEKKFLVVMLMVAVLEIVFLIASQFTKQWYEGGSGDCTWKGDSTSIYSSKCYSHKDYSDTKCSGCSCCNKEVNIHKLGHSILPFIIAILFTGLWIINFVVCFIRNVDYDGYYFKLCRIFTMPGMFLTIIEFSVESFGLTDEKIKAGMGLRITALLIFAVFAILLFQFTNSLKGLQKKSLFSKDENPLPLINDAKVEYEERAKQNNRGAINSYSIRSDDLNL